MKFKPLSIPPWPKAIVFDLDGTLIDSAPSIARALNQVIAERGGKATTPDLVRKLVSQGAAEMVVTCLGDSATNVGADLAAFRAIYGSLAPDPADLYPGARETLKAMSTSGLLLGICTNKPQILTKRILDGLALTSHFGAIVGGTSALPPKPHPAMALRSLQLLGAEIEESIFVGDSEVDAEAAAAAGIPFVLVEFGYPAGAIEAIPASGRVANFKALAELLVPNRQTSPRLT